MALKGGHVRCTLTDRSGGRLKAVAWRAGETELGRRLLEGAGAVHVAGRLKPDDWQGRESVELEIEDVADPRRVEVAG
jgi:single-stranded-DNA-specific exonuclease